MGGGRVLVVDDNDLDRKLVRDVLLFHAFEVREAATAMDALATVQEFRPHVVLLDIQLGADDGVSVLEALRGCPEGWGCTVVALTANAMAGDRDNLIGAGFDGYLSKPIDVLALPDVIYGYCGTSAPEEDYGPATPDPGRR